MARIREDLDGVVTAGSVTLRAGDVIPDGVCIGGHLTEDGVAVNAPVAASPVMDGVEPLNDDEKAAADDLGIPRRGVNPDLVRGALIGYREGWDAAVVELAREQAERVATADTFDGQGTLETFDPTEHNAIEVHEYIAAHPDEKDAVLALEVAGKNRSSLLAKYTT